MKKTLSFFFLFSIGFVFFAGATLTVTETAEERGERERINFCRETKGKYNEAFREFTGACLNIRDSDITTVDNCSNRFKSV